jgi:hypothetical protein
MQTVSVVSVALDTWGIFWRRKKYGVRVVLWNWFALEKREKKDFSNAYVPTCREEKSFFSLFGERIII